MYISVNFKFYFITHGYTFMVFTQVHFEIFIFIYLAYIYSSPIMTLVLFTLAFIFYVNICLYLTTIQGQILYILLH